MKTREDRTFPKAASSPLDVAACGAKTRAGTPCKNSGTGSGGRCKFHGGATPKGSHVKHGVYVKALTKEELEIWHDIPLGTLDDEIRLLKIQILRALEADKPELINLLTRTVTRLETTRKNIGGGAGAPDEIAREIKDALDAIEDLTDGDA